jgi:precorrin-3B synthase
MDACPGALQTHTAADGGVARIRVPGGRLTASAFRVVVRAADELGDGTIELTSRANLQIRGLAPGAEVSLGQRLAAAGLLPSATHERVRNIMASPLGGPDVRRLVSSLDTELCARPSLAELPGRFLFTVDDGTGDVAWLGADIAALLLADTSVILLGGKDVGLRAAHDQVVSIMLECAERFLALRTTEWRLAELPSGPARVASTFPLVDKRVEPSGVRRWGVGIGAPLGRLTVAQGSALAAMAAELVITPWRRVVVDPALDEVGLRRLASLGLITDPDAPLVTACVGRPGCAKALADVRTDAVAMLPRTSLPVHWSGCDRRCGRPRGEVLDLIATEAGYVMRQGHE